MTCNVCEAAEAGDLHHTYSSSDCVANARSHQVDILNDGTEGHVLAACRTKQVKFKQRTELQIALQGGVSVRCSISCSSAIGQSAWGTACLMQRYDAYLLMCAKSATESDNKQPH